MASADAQVSVAESHRPSDLERLEVAVRELAALRAALQADNAALEKSVEEIRRQWEEAEVTTRDLQERLLVEGQLRQDALKRIDDLVGLIEQLDPSLASGDR